MTRLEKVLEEVDPLDQQYEDNFEDLQALHNLLTIEMKSAESEVKGGSRVSQRTGEKITNSLNGMLKAVQKL